jgi:hypothetical protein
MSTSIATATLAGALAALSACALVPQENVRLEEAKASVQAISADPEAQRLAPRELNEAVEAMQRAIDASATLQDPALVDHLAYIAKQRGAIVRAHVERARNEEQARARAPSLPRT